MKLRTLPLIAIAMLALGPSGVSDEKTFEEALEAFTKAQKEKRAEAWTTDLANALKVYNQLRSEGKKPAIVIKEGEVRLIPASYAGEFGNAFSMPDPALYQTQIATLKEQVEKLKEVNAELKRQLAACKPQP